MHAFRGKNGKILAPCIHFRVQSGGFGYMARESCRQGRLFASRGPEIMHGAKNLPALLDLFVAAACSLLEWALPPHRPYLVCLTHERAPAILVALTAITPCRRLAIAAPPGSRTPLRPPIPLPRAPPPPASPPAPHPPRRAPATRRTSSCRAGPAAVPVIPAKWCGDTIAHTRKLRF